MKKCPSCAEEIQDDAIKCKHCKEWLKKQDNNAESDLRQKAEEENSEAVSNTSEQLAEAQISLLNKITEDEDESKYTPLKPKGKYGWGWFLFLAMFASGHKVSLFYNPAISVIEKLSFVPLLAVYFWLRNRLLKKIKYGQKKWLAGFKAGLLTYLIWCVLFLPATIFDASLKKADLNTVSQKYYEKAKNLQQEEQQLINSLIKEPTSVADLRVNAGKIDAILTLAEQKRNVSHAMFDAFKEIHIKDGEKGKGKIDAIKRLETLGGKQYETQKKAWESLKKYYLTGNENFFNEYSALEIEADKLKTEYQQMDKDFLLR